MTSIHDIVGRRPAFAAAVASVAVLFVAACGPIAEPVNFQYDTEEVDAATLPFYSPEKIYRYRFATVNTDSLIRVLVAGRMPIDEAWLSTEDSCASAGDPIGPRFTVILAAQNSQMSSFEFDQGSGIPGCSTRVLRFTVSRFN
jgi:hypothetical protein